MQEIIAPEHVQDPWEKNVPGLVSGAHTDALSGDSHSGFSIWQTVAAGRHGRNHRPCTAAGRALMLSLLGLLRPRRTEHAWLG
jgi:hypothetical protein